MGLGCIIAALLTGSYWSLLGLSLITIGLYAPQAHLFPLPAVFLTGPALASGIAWINSFGILGGSASPQSSAGSKMPPAALAAASTRSPYLVCSPLSSPPSAYARRPLRSRSNLLELPQTDPVRSDSASGGRPRLEAGRPSLMPVSTAELEYFGARGAQRLRLARHDRVDQHSGLNSVRPAAGRGTYNNPAGIRRRHAASACCVAWTGVCSTECQVRNGLRAGERQIRTFGPPAIGTMVFA
jgi:hypothetical protein